MINIPNVICRVLIENIHNKRNFNRNLFCNGIIPLTPAKAEASSEQAQNTCTSNSPNSEDTIAVSALANAVFVKTMSKPSRGRDASER